MKTFFEHYKSLPDKAQKRQLRKTIVEECAIEQPTFYGWLHREKVPRLAQKVISQLLSMPQSELFPESQNCRS